MSHRSELNDRLTNGRQPNGEKEKENGDIELIQNSRATDLQRRVESSSFAQWYREREFADNIRQGKHFFNGASPIKPTRHKSPSSLLQCPRKAFYRELSAPEESQDPTGIYWAGSKIENEVILPFLEQHVTDPGEFVTNSIWVDYLISTAAGKVRIRGETDPVIVTPEAEPILPLEVKSQRDLDNLDEPKRHHRAQTHAYIRGLREKFEVDLQSATIIYVGRTHMDLKAFDVQWDSEFWEDVESWIADLTAYRLEEELPPAAPIFDWECQFCSYRNRCGKGSAPFENLDARGFVPGVTEYPREKITAYLETYPDEKLTPALADLHPDLSETYEVYGWMCRQCGWEGQVDEATPVDEPLCPKCAQEEKLSHLVAEHPDDHGGWQIDD